MTLSPKTNIEKMKKRQGTPKNSINITLRLTNKVKTGKENIKVTFQTKTKKEKH